VIPIRNNPNFFILKGDDYIIERAGKPLVAIISMEKYQMLQKERKEDFCALEKIWGKMKSEKPEVIEKAIGEALRLVRNV